MTQLRDAITEYQKGFQEKVSKEVQEVMQKAKQELENTKIRKNALQVNDKAREIQLPNALGKEVSLYETLEDNDFVVLNFYRGAWCSYCNLELRALQNINTDLNALGAKLIAISPQSPDASMSTKEKNELEFEVLSDTNNIVAKEYGLVFSLADELRPIYKSFGIDIPAHNKEESYELPMPAIYIINKNKEIIFSFIDEDYTKRCEPQEILDVIRNNR
jgi:peroxiredoxin